MGARERFARRSIARSLLSSSFNTIHAKNTPKTSLMRAFVSQGRKGAIVDGAIDDSRRRTFSSVGASTSGRDVASNESGSRRGVTDASNNGGRRRGNDDSRLARRTFASEASQHLPNKKMRLRRRRARKFETTTTTTTRRRRRRRKTTRSTTQTMKKTMQRTKIRNHRLVIEATKPVRYLETQGKEEVKESSREEKCHQSINR